MDVYKYRAHCDTEGIDFHILGEGDTAPTTCPNGHPLNSATLVIVDHVSDAKVVPAPFADASGYRARYKGFRGVALAGQITNLDYQLPVERWINGLNIHARNAAFGDRVHFEIVHPAGAVLDRFGEDWYVSQSTEQKVNETVPYPARIPAGLIVRVVYHSTGHDDVDVLVNMRLHMKPG